MSTPAIRGMSVLQSKALNPISLWLALTRFQSWVFLVNNISFAFSNDDLAIFCSSFNTTFYFHVVLPLSSGGLYCSSLMSICNSTFGHIVLAYLNGNFVTWKDTNVESSHFPADICEYFMSVFKLDFEPCVRQGFNNFRFERYFFFFCHSYTAYAPLGFLDKPPVLFFTDES